MPDQKRQLAAIMFTDIEGYTALMGKDEAAAYQLLKKNRKVQRPLIEMHGGKWLKELGDGVLASFQTISDAVYCAIEIQRKCEEEPDLKLRIGIHLGEVILEEGDVFGDGVNIASRLEPLAPAGGIYVSESVYRNIQNKKGIKAEYVGEEALKNVEHPIRIYEIDVQTSEVVIPDSTTQKPVVEVEARFMGWKRPMIIIPLTIVVLVIAYFVYNRLERSIDPAVVSEQEITDKSIAVIPFVNISNDPDQAYFSDGMMEEILMHLYKIGDLQVASRTSAMRYKDTDKLIGEIAYELGVRHILEGSVRKEGDRVRIQVQLFDAVSNQNLWAESYDEDLKSVFTIQSDVAHQVALALKAEISPEVNERIERIPTNSAEAYNMYLQARYLAMNNLSERKNIQILLEKAISLDPDFASAYARLGFYWLVSGSWSGTKEPEELLKEAFPLIQKALKIDNDLAIAHVYLSLIYL